MKKRITVILLTLVLLAGCQSQAPAAPAAPSATDTPDRESIIQQSVDEAVREKMAEYEEKQRKKDEEIARLKDRIEDLTGQPEAPSEDSPSAPAGDASSQAPASSSQTEVPPQPEPEPPPQSTPTQKKAAPSSGQGLDLRNMYPGFVFEESESGEAGEPEEDPEPGDGSETGEEPAGRFRLEDALEVVRLTNKEREKNGLPALEVDEDLMELARIRAEEIREKYSHTRPDGTTVVDLRCGENCGQSLSAEKQITAWMNSEGHRTNILLDRYHHMGAGCYQASNGNLYWVLVFSLD